ncbi:MAG: polyprenyl synthetase family protein, partial [Planctomycetota bacterium]
MTAGMAAVFHEYAQRRRAAVEAALDHYTQFDADCPDRLRLAIRHSLLAPGKRLRPLLVLMAAEACGTTMERAMPAACAVERVHTYSLIHDDLPAISRANHRG